MECLWETALSPAAPRRHKRGSGDASGTQTPLQEHDLHHRSLKKAVMIQHLRVGTLLPRVEIDDRSASDRAGKSSAGPPDAPHLNQAIKHLGHRSVYAIGPGGSDRDVRFRALHWAGYGPHPCFLLAHSFPADRRGWRVRSAGLPNPRRQGCVGLPRFRGEVTVWVQAT